VLGKVDRKPVVTTAGSLLAVAAAVAAATVADEAVGSDFYHRSHRPSSRAGLVPNCCYANGDDGTNRPDSPHLDVVVVRPKKKKNNKMMRKLQVNNNNKKSFLAVSQRLTERVSLGREKERRFI
jgi:hypothetical protein